MPWKPEYAERRRARYHSDPAERERRKAQGRDPEQNAEYMRGYYAGNKGKWKRSPEQQAEVNRRRRERYDSDAEIREQAKAAARSRTPETRREQFFCCF